MIEKFPKKFKTRDGTELILRPMTAEDGQELFDFFSKVPEEDRLYLKDDVSKRSLISRWADNLDYDRVLPLLALVDDQIVADGTLHQHKFGWKRHIGTIRLVVARNMQHHGIGHIMIDELCDAAADFGLEQVIVEVPNKVKKVIDAFEKAGFEKVTVMKDLIKDQHGDNTDVAVMVRKIFAPYEI